MKTLRTLGALSVATAIASSAALTALPATAAPASMTIYVSSASCKAGATGTKAKPVCNIGAASNLAAAAYKKGGARGNVFVRLDSAKPLTFVTKGAKDASARTWTFAPVAGSTVYFIPDWYGTSAKPTNNGARGYAMIRPDSRAKIAKGGATKELLYGLEIAPTKNRGGTFEVRHLDIRGFMSGLFINGGLTYADRNDPVRPENAAAHGATAPIDNARIIRNNFERIGNIYGDAINADGTRVSDSGNAAIMYRNTTNLQILANRFTDIKNKNYGGVSHTGKGHVSYGIGNAGATWRGNVFTRTNLSVIHTRMTGGETIANNTFIDTVGDDGKLERHVGRWHQTSLNAPKGRFAECENAPAKIANDNKITLKGKTRKLVQYNSAKGAESPICNSANRVRPVPALAGALSSSGYTLTWSPAQSGAGIKNYAVTIASTDKDEKQLALLPATARSYTITPAQLKKAKRDGDGDVIVAVTPVNTKSNRAGRTAMRHSFNPDTPRPAKFSAVSWDYYKTPPKKL